MKNKIYTSLAFLFSLSFIGCGNSTAKQQEIAIAITTYCVENPSLLAIDTYMQLQTGDVIVKNEDETLVKTYADTAGTLRVCLVSGSANIIR